ncbi:MAG: DNA polymerase III subunit gamma/tau [Prevotellaceae bacterium]|nr:DNA polymerase III subunit gamma/tau [Prevotellaceae bacterium]
MEDFIVSARKYRPATFDTVVGQRALTTTLLNAIRTRKLAHAYLFCGPRGVGKTTCARIFAKTINCLSPRPDGEACDQCESCVTFNQQRSMNIHELDAASNNSVDDIRQLIEQVRIPPQGGRYKVFIIDEVHMLSSQAFNAFLKTLEEPPSYVIFILATTEKHKILPTILSRCQVYDFAPISVQNTVDHLQYVADKEGYTAEPQALNLIARKADGGMRDALSIFDQMVSFTGGNITYQSALQNLNVLDTDYYFRLVDLALQGQVEASLLLFDEVLRKGFDGGNFINGLASHLRDLLVCRDPQTLCLLEQSKSVQQQYSEQAQRCQPAFLLEALKLCNTCDLNYRQSRNKRLQVELCLIEMAQLVGTGNAPKGEDKPKVELKPIASPSASNTASAPAKTSASPATAAPKPAPTAQASPLKVATETAPNKHLVALDSVCIQQKDTAPKDEAPTMVSEAAAFYVTDSGKLTDGNLIQCWQQFANALKPTDVATANRLLGVSPRRVSESEFQVTAGSDKIESELSKRRADIERFVARHIGMDDVRMTIVLVKPEQAQQAFSKPYLFNKMKEENPALADLEKALGLEIV